MMKWILPLLWSSTVFAQGFLNGNEFTSHNLRGDLYLTCYGNGQRVTVRKRCQKSALLPVAQDFFLTSEKIDGDRVRLKNVSDKGSDFDKTVYYDKDKQRTHKKVKLWGEYWGEEGLLNQGLNNIAYEFQNSNKEQLLQGQLEINVEDGGRRFCRDGQDVSYNLSDCYYHDNDRYFCERYFEWNRYCG